MRQTHQVHDQVVTAYHRMAVEAHYRPAAPSDGMGTITVPLAELNVDAEAARYSVWWWAEEDQARFNIGCCDYRTRPATIFAIEAARNLCGGNKTVALDLLRMAVADLEDDQ